MIGFFGGVVTSESGEELSKPLYDGRRQFISVLRGAVLIVGGTCCNAEVDAFEGGMTSWLCESG